MGKFTNIRSSRFDKVKKSIRFSVNFWPPSAPIRAQNLAFPKINPTNYLVSNQTEMRMKRMFWDQHTRPSKTIFPCIRPRYDDNLVTE